MKEEYQITPIPTKWIGPLLIQSCDETYEVDVPLATYETPLWPSVTRGARLCHRAGGIRTTVFQDTMARSIVFQAENGHEAFHIACSLEKEKKTLFHVAQKTSSHLANLDISIRFVGPCVFVRLQGSTDEASGHNMITKASDKVLSWILSHFPKTRHLSVSGNYCTDKKVSSVNAILGRGKGVIAEVFIPRKLCTRYLKTTPEAIVELNIKKNLLGSIINGGVQSANAHFANMLLAIFLATGQDAANIVEGSQGITFCEINQDSLYFSVTLPNIIVGSIGHGKDLGFQKEALKRMGCLEKRGYGENSHRLAEIVAAVVLAGELSLLAAQTKPGELVETHMTYERGQ